MPFSRIKDMTLSFSPWIILITVLIVFILRTHLKIYIQSAWLVLRLPGPRALPIIGHMYLVFEIDSLKRAVLDVVKNYGLVISTWISVFPYVTIIDPKDAQKILTSSKHVEKAGFYKMMHSLVGTGLVTSDATRWRVHRKLLQPVFNLSTLESFVTAFNKASKLLSSQLQDQVATGKREIKISPIINQVVLSALAEIVLGVPIGSLASRKMQEESPYNSSSSAFLRRLFKPWLLIPAVFKITQLAKGEIEHKNALITYTEAAMKERRRLHSEGVPIAQKCILDFLLQCVDENPGVFTDDDCVQEAITLMLVGQDSVGAALGLTFHLLANHPKQQEKAAQEQIAIFGDATDPANLINIRKMTYLDMCIKESLRLYPTVPIFARTLAEDVQLGKWHLPKGCGVIFFPFATHRLEQYYPDPNIFIPERFDPASATTIPQFAYFPFSAGPRNCIGYKYAELLMKTAISTVLRDFKLSPVEGKEDISLTFRITLRAKGGVWVTLTPRHNNISNQSSITV